MSDLNLPTYLDTQSIGFSDEWQQRFFKQIPDMQSIGSIISFGYFDPAEHALPNELAHVPVVRGQDILVIHNELNEIIGTITLSYQEIIDDDDSLLAYLSIKEINPMQSPQNETAYAAMLGFALGKQLKTYYVNECPHDDVTLTIDYPTDTNMLSEKASTLLCRILRGQSKIGDKEEVSTTIKHRFMSGDKISK